LADALKNISTLLYPTDWLPTGNEIQKSIVDDFTASIESLLGVKVTKVSLIERWKETAPEEVRGIALPDYLRKVKQSEMVLHILFNAR